jgi:diguanylate cyclase (GGDEF)-like protein
MPSVAVSRHRTAPFQPRVGRRFALKLGAALTVLASILIVGAVWSLGQSTENGRRSQAGDQLAFSLGAAHDEIDAVLRELDARADQFVRHRAFQEAVARSDATTLERLASAQPGITVYLGGRRLGRKPAGLRLSRELVLRRDGRAIGRVVTSLAVDKTLYSRIHEATPLGQGHRLLVVAHGRVLLGDAPGTRIRSVAPDETAVGGVRFLTRSAALPGGSARLVAAAPGASVTAGVREFQRRLLLASFGSLALLLALAAALGGPILRVLGDFTRVARAAELDALTGVANRSSFDARLAEEVRRAETLGTPLSLILLDIDHFKAINDTHGHQAGDEVLRRMGALLQDRLRQTDFGARYGGEEFAVVLPNTGGEGAMLLAERLRAAVSELRVLTGEIELTPTASFGVASFPEQAGSDLVAVADAALYQAKRSGRDRAVAAPPAAT